MAYKVQVGNFDTAGDIKAGMTGELKDAISISDAAAATVIAQVDAGEIAGDKLAIHSSAPGLQSVNDSGQKLQLKVKASSGLVLDGDGVAAAVANGIEFSGGALAAKIKSNSGLGLDGNGLQVNLVADALHFDGASIDLKDQIAGARTFSDDITFNGNVDCNAGNINLFASVGGNDIVIGGDTSTVVINGKLQVDGTLDTRSATEIQVEDITLQLAQGAADSAAANGAGLKIDGADAFLTWDHGNTRMNLNQILAATSFVGNVAGNATSATALATPRNIGGVAFDGSANIDLPGVNQAGNQNTSGNAASATALATPRNIGGVAFDGSANINLPGVNQAGNQDTSGTAAQATILAVARTIGGVSFNGSANIVPATITVANEATDTSCNILFSTAATGDLGPKSNASLTFNSNTGQLAATSYAGDGSALTGVVMRPSVIKKADGNTLDLDKINYLDPMAADGTDVLTVPDCSNSDIGKRIWVKAPSDTSATRILRLQRASSSTIDGATQVDLLSPDAAIMLVCVANNEWKIF